MMWRDVRMWGYMVWIWYDMAYDIWYDVTGGHLNESHSMRFHGPVWVKVKLNKLSISRKSAHCPPSGQGWFHKIRCEWYVGDFEIYYTHNKVMLKSILWKPLSCITYITLVQPLCNFTLNMAVSRLSSVQNLKAIGELRTRFWTNEIPRDLNLSGISQEKVYCIKLFSSILRWLPSFKYVSLINIHSLIFCNYLWLFTKSHTTTYTDRTNIHNTLYHDIDSFRVMWVRCSYKISCRKISQFRSHAMCPLECISFWTLTDASAVAVLQMHLSNFRGVRPF